jgi:Protein of unknown function (DUF2541)
MNRRNAMKGVAALMVLSPTRLLAQQVSRPRAGGPGEWRVIGTTRASHAVDHDTLAVAGPFDDFRAIKFKVTGAPLNLHRVVVTYENGEPDRLDVRHNIAQGGESRTIDLRGAGKRRIRKIEFWYDTKGLTNREAAVTVLGMK